MNSSWNYLVNTFALLAGRSMLRFHKFCYLFMLGLKNSSGNSFLDDMYADSLADYETFVKAFNKNFGDKGKRKSMTEKQKKLLKELSSQKAHEWDVKIQNFFLEGTTEYMAIFPQGLTPFSRYQIEMRITYLENALTEITQYPDLVLLQEEIKQFLLDLKNARDKKVSKATEVKQNSDELNKAALKMAEKLYANLGKFITQYASNPQEIAAFFPLYLLHYKKDNANNNDNIYELNLAASEKLEAGFNFGYEARINIYNTGDTILHLWFTDNTNSAKPNNYIQLAPQEIRNINVNQYANQAQRFLITENTSATEAGSIEFSLV